MSCTVNLVKTGELTGPRCEATIIILLNGPVPNCPLNSYLYPRVRVALRPQQRSFSVLNGG